MVLEAWLPVGFALPGGEKLRLPVKAGEDWQIVDAGPGHLTLIVKRELAEHWVHSGLIDLSAWVRFTFGPAEFLSYTARRSTILAALSDVRSPSTGNEAIAFAVALRETRAIEKTVSLHDAVYVEALSRLLPTYSITEPMGDDVVLGRYLTGVPVSVYATRRVRALASWINEAGLCCHRSA